MIQRDCLYQQAYTRTCVGSRNIPMGMTSRMKMTKVMKMLTILSMRVELYKETDVFTVFFWSSGVRKNLYLIVSGRVEVC